MSFGDACRASISAVQPTMRCSTLPKHWLRADCVQDCRGLAQAGTAVSNSRHATVLITRDPTSNFRTFGITIPRRLFQSPACLVELIADGSWQGRRGNVALG